MPTLRLGGVVRALLAAACLWASVAPAATAAPPVWVVHGRHTTLILFGSVHLLPPGLDWEPPRLRQAIAHANEIWFEIPLDPQATTEAAKLAAAKGLLPVGEKLSDELPPKDWSRVTTLAQSYGVSTESLNRMRPWLAEITLSVAGYAQLGAMAEQGVERQLAAQAPAGVNHRAFETLEAQIDALSGDSLPGQIASLEETLGELEQGPTVYETLLKAWLAGDTGQIDAVALAPVLKAAPESYQALVVARNQRWLAAIQQRLKQPGEAVMVVGVGHLIGPDGLPSLLRERGVRVDGP